MKAKIDIHRRRFLQYTGIGLPEQPVTKSYVMLGPG